VVNPLGVIEPTIGWKRAPLSAIAIIFGVISNKCFTSCILKCILAFMIILHLEIYMLNMYAHSLCSL
jgi:hypothetical protein